MAMVPCPWFVGLDFGSASVAVALGTADAANRLRVYGYSEFPTGAAGGTSELDRPALRRSLAPVVDWLGRQSTSAVSSVALGVSGRQLRAVPSSAECRWSHHVALEPEIIEAARRRAAGVPRAQGTVLASSVRSYRCNEQRSAHPPFGIWSDHLAVEVRSWVLPSEQVEAIAEVLDEFGFVLGALAPRSAAAAELTLDPVERERGAAVIHVGSRETEVSVFTNGGLTDLFTIPLGTDAVIDEVVNVFGVGRPVAEKIVLGALGTVRADTPRVRLARAAVATRSAGLLGLVRGQLDRAEVRTRLASGVIITGIGARLPGIEQVARGSLGLPARVGAPTRPDVRCPGLDAAAVAAAGLLAVEARVRGVVGFGEQVAVPDERVERDTRDDEPVDHDEVHGAAIWGSVRPILGRWLREFIPSDHSA